MIKQIKSPQTTYQGTCPHCKAEYTWEEMDCIKSMTTPSIYCPHCGHIISRWDYRDWGTTDSTGNPLINWGTSTSTTATLTNNRDDGPTTTVNNSGEAHA